MSTRFLTRSLLAATLALTGAGSRGMAQQQSAPAQNLLPAPQLENVLTECLYPVADLITPIAENAAVEIHNQPKPSEVADPKKQAKAGTAAVLTAEMPLAKESRAIDTASAKTREDELVNLLTTCVDPESWVGRGGKSTIAYHAGCMTLAVHAPPAQQEKITQILAGLRREQQTQVSLEVRVVTISEALAARLGLNLNGAVTSNIPSSQNSAEMTKEAAVNSPRATFFDRAQLVQFMESIQGDQRTNVMQLPKITVANGRKTKFSVADTQFFVTHVDVKKVGGTDVFVPQNEVLQTSGFNFSVLPTISADRRFVNLDLLATFTKLSDVNVRLFPITTFITPVFEGGAVGQPVPFTQFLQQPSFSNVAIDRKLSLPDGGTVVLSGYRQMAEGNHEFAPPVLSKVPYLNRLFKQPGYLNEPLQVMLLVTPRIIIAEEEETRVVLAHQVSKFRGANPSEAAKESLSVLLAKYRQACGENRMTDAQALAAKALLLDPACFSK